MMAHVIDPQDSGSILATTFYSTVSEKTHSVTREGEIALFFFFFFLMNAAAAAAAAKALQSYPTLCDPIDGSPPGSLVPGILQARTLEWLLMNEYHIICRYLKPLLVSSTSMS